MQICGQVNNYPGAALRFQRQFAAECADPFAHPLNAEARLLVRTDADAVVPHLEVQKLTLLIQDDGDFAGFGVFAHVVEQLLQQPVEGEAHRLAGGRVDESVVEMATDAPFAKGEFIQQVVKRVFERQLVQRGRAKLAQQLARGVMNAPGEIGYLVRGGLGLRRIARPLDQLRLDLNRGDVLADFIVQLARQVFSRVFFGVDQFSVSARRAASSSSRRRR